MIANKVDGILLVPSSSDGLESALTKCKEAGIPIINLDTKLTDESLANVGLDIPFYGTTIMKEAPNWQANMWRKTLRREQRQPYSKGLKDRPMQRTVTMDS